MTETWHYTIRDGERCTLTYDPDTGEDILYRKYKQKTNEL